MSERQSPFDAGTAPAGDAGTPPKPGETAKVAFSEEQQRELNRLIAAARREGKDSAKAEAERANAEAAGAFEAVRSSLLEERDSARTERDQAHTQLNDLLAALKPEIEAAWGNLPAEITKLYEGGEADVLAKRSFMTRHAELIEKLTGSAEAEKQRLRTPRTPAPAQGSKNGTFEPLSPVSI